MKTGEKTWRPTHDSGAGSEASGQFAVDGSGQIVCPNCGAGFSAEDARCPYCGELNPSGAESAYMNTLSELREDTSELVEHAQDDLDASLQRNVKRTIAIVVGVVLALGALFAIGNFMDKHEERQELKSYQAREAFRVQYFPEFDRLYEAGDYDALSSYVWSLMNDPGFDALFSWKHVGFLEVHDGWEAIRSVEDDIEAGTCGIDDYTWTVLLALRLAQLDAKDSPPSATLSQDEEERAAGYRAYAWQFLQDKLQMSRDEVASFADAAKDSEGHIEEGTLKQSLEAHLRQIGALG